MTDSTDPVVPHPDDDRLLQELRRVTDALDPMPAAVRAAARAAPDRRRRRDAVLAILMADTAAHDEDLALVRSGGAEVLLSFAAGDVSVELEVRATAEGRELAGQLLPPQPAAVTLERPAGEPVELDADAHGRFSAGGLAPGPARLGLRVESAAGTRRFATPWTML
jgi:hypothetical protein